MYFFVTRESERKANQYEKLYNKLETIINKHDRKMTQVNEMFNSYKSNVVDFSNSVIPSNHFDPKREELTKKLGQYIQEESKKRSGLVSAKKIALERKNHYIHKVNQELAQERKEREQALKKIEEEAKKILKGG